MAPLRCTAKFDPFLFLGLCRVGGRDQILPSGHTGGKDGGDHRFHQKLVRSRSLIFTHAAADRPTAEGGGVRPTRLSASRHHLSSTRFNAAKEANWGEGGMMRWGQQGLDSVSVILGPLGIELCAVSSNVIRITIANE